MDAIDAILVDEAEVEKSMRGRRPKATKAPTKLERTERLREAIAGLTEALMNDGFGSVLPPPSAVQVTTQPIEDPETGGWIAHVEEPLGVYIQRVNISENFSQRPPFDHATDSIYKRLIRDFIKGAVMPEAKVAALAPGTEDHKARSLDDPSIDFSIIDGLQRLYCFCLALLLVWQREELVQEGLLPRDSWDYFSDVVLATGDPRPATERLLQRIIRYEIFYNIDLAGLLRYMVTFNTGQRRMSLQVQLEIMQRPLIQALEQRAKVPVWHEIQKIPGMQRSREKFAAADLVMAAQAFITNNAQLTATTEAERFLNEDQRYLDNVGDINDVLQALKRIATELHPKVTKIYADDPSRRFILSSGGTFLQSLVAACGYVRNRNNMKMADGALDKVRDLLDRPIDDPLRLDDYYKALGMITTSRGKTIRRLVYDTFLRFFSGATTEL